MDELEKLLVKFGNYLLSEERENNLINEQNKRCVTDADLSRFNLINHKYTVGMQKTDNPSEMK
jgi:hypothetical protein